MTGTLYSLDRIEGGVAVLLDPAGVPLELDASRLAPGVREGMLLRRGADGVYAPDADATRAKQTAMRDRVRRLMARKPQGAGAAANAPRTDDTLAAEGGAAETSAAVKDGRRTIVFEKSAGAAPVPQTETREAPAPRTDGHSTFAPVPQTLTLEKPAAIDLAQGARYFGVRGETDAATAALLQRCALPLLEAAAPRAVWLRAPVTALAPLLSGEDIAKHLAGCGECLLMAVTLGPRADEQIRRAGVGDLAAGVATDALASALAEQACDEAERLVREKLAGEHRFLTSRYSPGYGDWPLAVQPALCRLLDTVRRIGLSVTDTCLMTPRKSVTALLGISETPVTGQRAGCGHCALRERCEYRKKGVRCDNN